MARIILVDDDHDLSRLTQLVLSKEGYEVSVFHKAELAIKEAQWQKPDLILMDIMLPGINGGEAVRQLKTDPHLKNVPVIFLTALVSGQEKSGGGINVDGSIYKTFGKPYEIEDLLALLKTTLN